MALIVPCPLYFEWNLSTTMYAYRKCYLITTLFQVLSSEKIFG